MEPLFTTELARIGPRERLLMHGAASLGDADLLALLLGTGSAVESVFVLAARLLERTSGLHGLLRLSMSELTQQPGVGPTKAARLLAAAELGARVCARPLERERPLTSSRDVDAALRPRLAGEAREHFFAVPLDARNHPLAILEIAVGGLVACSISPSDVFRPVVREAAASVIFAHNHPSGELTPSEQDVAITERLVRAGELLGIQVLDHLVLGHRGYFSFLDTGLLRPPVAR